MKKLIALIATLLVLTLTPVAGAFSPRPQAAPGANHPATIVPGHYRSEVVFWVDRHHRLRAHVIVIYVVDKHHRTRRDR